MERKVGEAFEFNGVKLKTMQDYFFRAKVVILVIR